MWPWLHLGVQEYNLVHSLTGALGVSIVSLTPCLGDNKLWLGFLKLALALLGISMLKYFLTIQTINLFQGFITAILAAVAAGVGGHYIKKEIQKGAQTEQAANKTI
jgi:hypothetical protein